jgi:hypothetical protein
MNAGCPVRIRSTGRLLALILGAGLLGTACDRGTSAPLAHYAYVWQREWTPATTDAMAQSAGFLGGWHVLLAETDGPEDWRSFMPRLPPAAPGQYSLTAVVRIDGRRQLEDADSLIPRLTHLLDGQPPGQWRALEIDYDCPTRSLGVYADFLRRLRAGLPAGISLSVTALPAWLSSPRLADLLAVADESVLQVHSVLDPRRGLFDADLARGWVASFARRSARPFFVALPDYGSRVGWDPAGRIVSIVSEQPSPLNGPGQQELLSRPGDVARFLGTYRQGHPANLRGMVWFRLPVAGDQRVWSLRTLEAVVRDQPLLVRRSVAIEPDGMGAYQITIRNTGNIDGLVPRRVRTHPCVAADAMAGYGVVHGTTSLSFVRQSDVLIRAGHSVAVGWTRCPVHAEDAYVED